jgi:hypothetical protein
MINALQALSHKPTKQTPEMFTSWLKIELYILTLREEQLPTKPSLLGLSVSATFLIQFTILYLNTNSCRCYSQ